MPGAVPRLYLCDTLACVEGVGVKLFGSRTTLPGAPGFFGACSYLKWPSTVVGLPLLMFWRRSLKIA